ncbi:MAG: hypothetical protein ACK5OX_01770 [Desertimonas sp.]
MTIATTTRRRPVVSRRVRRRRVAVVAAAIVMALVGAAGDGPVVARTFDLVVAGAALVAAWALARELQRPASKLPGRAAVTHRHRVATVPRPVLARVAEAA